jgi:hypothetical protein
MPLRSLLLAGSCPDTAACPSSCRRRAAVLGREHQRRFPIRKRSCRSRSSSHFAQQSLQRVVRSQTPPVFTWKGVVVQLQFRLAHARQRRLASSLSASRRLARLCVGQPRDLPARESLSASPPLPSPCSSVPPSTHSDKNAPRTAVTTLPDLFRSPRWCRRPLVFGPGSRRRCYA